MWKKITSKSQKEIRRKQMLIYSQNLLEESGIDNRTKQAMLYEIFGKWSRKQLTDSELNKFINILENNGKI